MLHSLLLPLLCLQTQIIPPPDQPPTTAPAPTYDVGPLRIELIGVREMRFWTSDPTLAARVESDLQMRLRVQGERVDQIARVGTVILTEVVDDTGKALLDDDLYKDVDKTATQTLTITPDRLRDTGLLLSARTRPSARGARQLKVFKGTLRVVLSKDKVKYTVLNPHQYYGQKIADARLAALGIEIEVISPDQVENSPPAERSIIIRYKTKREHVQNASFCDGWLRPLPTRDNWLKHKETGEQCQAFFFEPNVFNDEMQIVFEVHPQIDDVTLPIDIKGFELP
jgi:hypothetical protein